MIHNHVDCFWECKFTNCWIYYWISVFRSLMYWVRFKLVLSTSNQQFIMREVVKRETGLQKDRSFINWLKTEWVRVFPDLRTFYGDGRNYVLKLVFKWCYSTFDSKWSWKQLGDGVFHIWEGIYLFAHHGNGHKSISIRQTLTFLYNKVDERTVP